MSREIRHLQNSVCACAVLFPATLTTIAQLLFDSIKHVAAHFVPFLASFLLVLTIFYFQDTNIR